MKVNLDEVKEIVETLPISYYAKRRIKMVLERKTDVGTSYYDPAADEIHIDYSLIAQGLEKAPDTENETYKETAVRSMVYHELSHAILTPNYRLPRALSYFDLPPEIFNIFEDERIETILKDFYIDVNFKKNWLYINGDEVPTPTTPIEKFVYLVRFRGYKGTALAKEVDRIIEKYGEYVNCNCDAMTNPAYYYIRDISDLWEKFCKEEKTLPTPSPEESEEIKNSINNGENGKGFEENKTEEKKNKSKKEDGEGKGKGKEGKGEEGEEGEGEGENKEGEEGEEGEAKNLKKGSPAKGKKFGRVEKVIERALTEKYNVYHDPKLIMELDKIISNFNKKNNTGNGCTSYSGVLNPRNTAREDYRYFDKKVSCRGNNPYGTLHLNLYIDTSGSFCHLQDTANGLINALKIVERKNHNFTFDVAFSSDGITETTKDNCFIKAEGGNALDYEDVLASVKKHKKKNAYVYNIVLHDGALDCVWCGTWHSRKNPFAPWDNQNTTIIDTGDNKACLKQLKSARIVISPYDKLVTTLGQEVIKTLQIAFR